MFTIPVMRYLHKYNVSQEQLAMVAVVQREYAARNPNAMMKDPITVEDVLNSRMIAYPFRLFMCCLVTDGSGALILTSSDRAKDFPTKPVYILGTGESVETPMVSQMEDFTSSRAFRVAGPNAFREAGIKHDDVDHLMIYDAFAHLPLYGLEDLGFVGRGEAGAFISDGTPARVGSCRSIRTVVASAIPTRGCTACTPSRRAFARCAGLPRRKWLAPRSACVMASEACSQPPVR